MTYFYDFNKNKVITRHGINSQYGVAGRSRSDERLGELNIYPILDPYLPEGMQVAKRLTAVDAAANRPVYVREGNYARRVIDVMYCDEECLFSDLIKQVQGVQAKAFVEDDQSVQTALQGIIYVLERHQYLGKEDVAAKVSRMYGTLKSEKAFAAVDPDGVIERISMSLAKYETIDDVNPNYVIPDNIRADLYGAESPKVFTTKKK